MATLMDLPLEQKNEIFRRVSIKEFPHIVLTCRSLGETLRNEYLWQYLYNRKQIKNYKGSYFESIKHYKKRWHCRWEKSKSYIVSENGSLIKNIVNNRSRPQQLNGMKALKKNGSITMRIEQKGYLFICLQTRPSSQNLLKIYRLLNDNLGIYTSQGHSYYGNLNKITSDSLKEGDLVVIDIKDNQPTFSINEKKIKFDLSAGQEKRLQNCNSPIFITFELQNSSIRIIND